MKKNYLLIAASLLILSGCSKVTKNNYDKIESGMSYDEVVKLIGSPEGCDEAFGITSCEWKSGKARINVKLVSDQVTFTSANNLQ